ncbi:MAG: hypothetical protein COA78_20480 [Blastopirellula sp.]|nr:MAG: hypothetical protein COA78_20480 [Blastopirellula sp.]
MKVVVSDIETNKLVNPDKLWLFGGMDISTKERYQFNIETEPDCIPEAIKWAKSVDLWIGHNFIQFDVPQVDRLLKPKLINPEKVIDTLLVSRLVNYSIAIPKGARSPHSLEAWGIRLGVHKGNFSAFEEFSEEMVTYWNGDLDTTLALYHHFLKYIKDPDWKKSLRCEHDTTIELVKTQHNGFTFNSDKAEGLLVGVKEKMVELEKVFQDDFPPILTLTKVLQYKTTKDGGEYATVKKAKESSDMTKVVGSDLQCYDYVPFNPGSPKIRIDKLWDAGWKPFEKTKTHQKFGRVKVGMPYGKSIPSISQEQHDEKKDTFARYGWSCNEDNLRTLPDTAPEGAKALAQWLTLEGRRSSLVEWLGQVQEDGKIHGSIISIGAWTGRASHNKPNTANISSPWHGTAVSPVDRIKEQFDEGLRSCWTVEKGNYLVGVDASGIQLRILGDYLWKHFGTSDYAITIINGDREKGTDIHNVNRKALNIKGLTRDDAKTFIYCWILNGGLPKIASILKTSIPIASSARSRFEGSIDGLSPFKNEFLPFIAKRRYFTGYDGRKVIVPSLHKTLAGILQNGEAVILKHAMIKWHNDLRKDGINFKMVTFVHDEYQTEVIGSREEAEYVKKVQIASIRWAGDELGLRCRLDGDGKVDYDWAGTH